MLFVAASFGVMCLQGRFPRSWRYAIDDLKKLNLDDNPGLEGCVPLAPQAQVTYGGTQITGLCNANASLIEVQQRQALEAVLPGVYVGVEPLHTKLINSMLQRVRTLGTLVSDFETSRTISFEKTDSDVITEVGHITLVVMVIDGAEYVTEVDVSCYKVRKDTWEYSQSYPRYLQLVKLAQKLPNLHRFSSTLRNIWGENSLYSSDQLPLGLPAAAPLLTTLSLMDSDLMGQLPEDWANWTSIQTLDLRFNDLTGTLPDSWGQAARMPHNINMNFRGNSNLSGTVPASWAHFSSGYINLEGTAVGGCMPGNVSSTLPSCERIAQAVEAAALLALKKLLVHAGATNVPGLFTWTSGERTAEHTSVQCQCSSSSSNVCRQSTQAYV
jgi:hypothetical protein